jgi:phage-related tail fiber protein
MSNTIRIKRRASGSPGAPAGLANAELAFNEVDDILYYGKGTGGAGGTATTVEAIGGKGAVVMVTGDQSVAGAKTFTGTIMVPMPTLASHAVSKEYADSLVPNVVGGSGITVTNGTGNVTLAADATIARLASPAFTGTPAAPTPTAGTNTTQLATTAFVQTAVSNVSSSGSAAKLTTARTIAATGDASWSVSFDGSANASAAITLANSGATAGTYPKVTVDAKGRVTSGTTLAVADIPTLTSAKISDFDTKVRTSALNQMAVPTADVSFNSKRLTSLAEPVLSNDAATKNYVDMAVQGLDPKASVRAATTANIAALTGVMTIDGVALVADDRILVKNQTTASQNGIYIVSAGTWARSDDASTWDELISAYVFVEQGATNAENGFLFTVDAGGVLGTTAVTVVQFSGAGQIVAGAGMTKSGNQLDVGAGAGIAVAADTVGLTGQALALHNLATNGIFVRTASGVVAARSVATSGTGISVSNGDGVAGNPTMSLSAALASIGAVTPAADRLVYYTGAAAAAVTTFTAFARSLMDDADAGAARTTLGLSTMATQAASAVAITGGTIDGITFDGGVF